MQAPCACASLQKPNDAYNRLLYDRNKTANRSRTIREFELKEIKNKTVQPDAVRYQVWREYGRKRDCIFFVHLFL